jgi:hypothetical protein
MPGSWLYMVCKTKKIVHVSHDSQHTGKTDETQINFTAKRGENRMTVSSLKYIVQNTGHLQKLN